MADILLVHETGAEGDAEFCATLAHIAAELGARLRTVSSAEVGAAAPATYPSEAVLAVIAPAVGRPLAVARRVAREATEARFVLTTASTSGEASLRREAIIGAPPGGRWAITLADEASLRHAIVAGLNAIDTQKKLRTTLDRAKFNLQSATAVDPVEYRRLVASDRYLARVLESAHDGIVSLDLREMVVSWNRAAQRLFRTGLSSTTNLEFASLFEDPLATSADLAAALRGERDNASWTLRHHDGYVVQVEAALDVVRDDSGASSGLVVILRDVTERQAVERMLRESNRQKDEFLAMLSHELRNPLAPIRNAAELLAHIPDLDKRARHAADIIRRQVGHMATLVEDLLDVARVTRGAIELERSPVQVSAALADAIEQSRGPIERGGHQLTCTATDRFACVLGDRTRLTQIFSNILVNSARYTPHGGSVAVELTQDGRDVVLRVVDNGIGIPAHVLPRVFDLFAQGERPSDRSEGGLGIGLALVKSLTELHGGRVSIESAGEGRGTTVTVRLPRLDSSRTVEDVLGKSANSTEHRAKSPLRIMVVDDNQDAAETLGLLMETEGHTVDVEIDPRQALARAPLVQPDVFILDIGMPHIDGYELARRIIAIAGPRKPLLIALTGYSQPSDKESARLAGFDHHLSKPLDLAQLHPLLTGAGYTARH